MMENIRGYFESLGITIDEELLQKLAQGLDLVSQYGSYSDADTGISMGSGMGSGNQDAISAWVQKMRENAAAWHEAKAAGNTSEQERLALQNESIAEILKKQYGLDIWKDSAKGVWYIRLDGSVYELFQKYHTGGVVDGYQTRNNREVMALLEKGEVVLNNNQQERLLSIFSNAKQWMQSQMANSFSGILQKARDLSPAVVGSGFGSFAPNITVHISHNGSMTDADARRYGHEIADAALDKLWDTMRKRGMT